MTTTQVRYTLSPLQKAVFVSPARWRVVVAGRRGGKSYLESLILLEDALRGPDRLCWYIAPTYKQGKTILWEPLRKLIPREYVEKVNETELSIHLLNGSKIVIIGADTDPDKLRGPGLHFAALDEFDQMVDGEKRIWEAVIRPMLSDKGKNGRAMFTTTPKGMGWAYEFFLKGQERREGFESWSWTTLQGGNVSPEEVADARAGMDPRLFRQEYEASFETLEGRVYDCFDRTLNVTTTMQDTGAELLVGMDFNVNPMSCVIGVRAADELHILDALEVPTSNTEEMAQELRRRYVGRKIIVCPDPSGVARKTSASVGVTDFTILAQHGMMVDAHHGAIPIPDRINAVQAMLKDASGRRRLLIHPRAGPTLIRALDGLTYKPGTSLPDKTSGLDHLCDALGYLVWQRFNLLNPNRAIQSVFYT